MAKKILVVDDDKDLVEIIKFELEGEKFLVDTAFNGLGGLNKLKEPPYPDLIILDVNMPVMDGVDFFQRVKNNPETQKIPILVLTSSGDLKDHFKKLDIGDFIAKPFSMGVFHYKVKFLLSGKKMQL